jgi:hemerythrin
MIPYVTWNDYYSVSEPSLDKEHKQIIFCINDLYEALQDGKSAQVVQPILDRLAEYTMTHFQHEEEIMQAHDYPSLAEHREVHNQMRKKTLALQEHPDTVSGQDLLVFLKQWWIEHIQGEDKKYAPYMELSGSRR